MKTKHLASLLISGFLVLGISSCKEDCVKNTKCSEQPPTGTTCTAYWENWIYNSDKKKCEFLGYSGCSPIGFDSKAECEKCNCD